MEKILSLLSNTTDSQGFILNTQNGRHFTVSNLPNDQYKIFDNEVYELKKLKTLLVYDFSDTYTQNEVYDWLYYQEDGKWVMAHCKNIHFETFQESTHQFFIICYICAYIKPQDFTFYQLKFS